jgi:hypothetical protein
MQALVAPNRRAPGRPAGWPVILAAAQTACRHLYPDNGEGSGVLTKESLGECEETGDCPQASVQA